MKVGFVGHEFHEKTLSSRFFVDFLKTFADVVEFYTDPDALDYVKDDMVRLLLSAKFDRIIFWQTEYIAARLTPFDLGRCFLVPMYDSVREAADASWGRFVQYRIIAFCRALHEKLQKLGHDTTYFQYFPDPASIPMIDPVETGRSAFFWERRPAEAISAPLVMRQCEMLGLSRLHVHQAPDWSDQEPTLIPGAHGKLQVTSSTWFDDFRAYRERAANATFYFAPRSFEGIGMANLEAMARGQIVVSPNVPAANEYVAHLVSGLLYEADDPLSPFDLPWLSYAELRVMGEAARRKIAVGHERWRMDLERLKSLILDDGRRWSTSDFSSHFATQIRKSAHVRLR